MSNRQPEGSRGIRKGVGVRHPLFGYGTVVRRTGTLAYVQWDEPQETGDGTVSFSVPVADLTVLT